MVERTICGEVRTVTPRDHSPEGEEQPFAMCPCGSGQNLWSLPQDSELSRMGDTFLAMGAAVNLASAVPTTTAHLAIANWEPHDGKCYAIQYVGGWISGTLAAAIIVNLFVEVSISPVTAFTAGVTPIPVSGRGSYRGNGRAKSSATVIADAWHSVGSSQVAANTAAEVMQSLWTPLKGRYIIPPGGCFSLTGTRNTGTVAWVPCIIWSEVSLAGGSQ